MSNIYSYTRRMNNFITYYKEYLYHVTDTYTGDPIMSEDKPKYKSAEEYPILTLESILSFGKYKGEQVEDLIEDDPSYIQWMVENEIRLFDEEVLEKLNDKGYGV